VAAAPELHLNTALAQGLRRFFMLLESRLALDQPLAVYLAGGMAVHLYTGQRVTEDVDAEFAGRVIIPQDMALELTLEDGSPQIIYLDTNYNSSFALMHENYQDDARLVDMGTSKLHIFVLSPVDLVVSKIARWAENDREDIQALVQSGLTDAQAIEERAQQALGGYVGNLAMLRLNLRDAVALAKQSASG
jgi:Nucleotidyltransferase of unknown function (DUF6036)